MMSLQRRKWCGSLLKFARVLVVAAAFLLTDDLAFSAGKLLQGESVLSEIHDRIAARLERNSFGVPLYLESCDREGRLHADVYGIFNHPFESISSVVKVPGNWCEAASLHPNVKACTYREVAGAWQLTFYGGRKFYQPPEDSYQLTYHFRNVEELKGYIDMVLTAGEGPFGTKDHRMRFEAIPLDGERTFVHVSYDYSYGRTLRLAENIYFATLGRNKVGFTVSGIDSNGKPVYVTGARGAIERNAVRYYFAIQAFMDTLNYPGESRLARRINEWYDLTYRFRRQLAEMDKKDYLAFKTEEHQNQVTLQRSAAASR